MMKQKEVFNKIGGIINELNDQYQYLQADPDNLHDLELELFVANTHFLADHAEVLRKINKQNIPAEKPVEQKTAEEKITEQRAPSHEEVFFEPVTRQPQPEIIKHELEIDESWADEEPEEEPIIVEEALKEEPVTEKDETHEVQVIVEAVAVPEPIVEPEVPVGAPPVTELDEVYTINQKISAQMGTKAEPAIQPISDLKSAITLNDKLLFVKDLFNGYSLAYSEAIEILNRFKGLEEADTFLKKNYMTKNNWEAKPGTVDKFYDLLKRRYA